MVFSSLLFIFAFLPIQLLVYYITPAKYKNIVLLIFSLIFYAWSGPGYLLILAGLSLISYCTANFIEKADNLKNKKIILIVEIVSHLSVLVFFKYLSFLAECFNSLLGICGATLISVPAIVLPIGISFYTFQLLSYVVDVYRGRVPAAKSYFKLLLYAGLFHQCIAGPIVRYETIANEIDNRKISIDEIFSGVVRFTTGLAKKTILANSCAMVADTLLPTNILLIEEQSIAALWIGAVFYALQIYLDFSAYSDMAIGMGRMTGFHYLENFNYPYISKSVTDFWRRWHISLSSFFRDYVYIPLGGNRVKAFRHIINLFIVWLLTGLWHGASINFVLWGLYYFLFLVIEKYAVKLFENSSKIFKLIAGIFYRIFTLIVIVIGWVIFRFDSAASLIVVIKSMFGVENNVIWNINIESELMGNIFLLFVSVIASTPIIKMIYRKLSDNKSKAFVCATALINVIVPALLIIISALALAGNSYNPFIYFRF